MKDYDVTIVGAGIVGILAALALAKTNVQIAVLDAKKIAPVVESDKINLVINATSLKIFEALGLGDVMTESVTRIDKCIISARDHFGRVRLSAKDLNESCLGKTIAADLLLNKLITKLQQHENITCFSECELTKISCDVEGARELYYNKDGSVSSIRTKLLLAADGYNSTVRDLSNVKVISESFDYTAVLFHVAMDAIKNAASQRFLSPGSIALIPGLENNACIIWTLPQHKAKARLKLDPAQLMSLAQHDLGKSAGKITGLASRLMSYPITMQRAEKITLPGLVFLGSVANQLLPITAQGLNLAIRDIAVMCEVLSDFKVWDSLAVERYNILRLDDHTANYQQIKYLVRLFGVSNTGLNILRSFGLSTIGASLPMARKITNIGFGNADYDFAARILDV